MENSRGRIFDDFTRLMNDAAGMAQGVRREAETMVRAQAGKILSTMELVSREEFEAVREMATLAREQNTRLEARLAALEEKLNAGH